MNPYLERLKPYPFERLAELKHGLAGPVDKPHIAGSIGEPQHAPPPFLAEVLNQQLGTFGRYPPTRGTPTLRVAIAEWLIRRFGLAPGAVDPERQLLPVSGTREALFAFTQCVVDARDQPLVLMPNPCYQIYEGAALLAGAEPYYLDTTAATGFVPDIDTVPESVWRRCALITICNPGNPTGAVMPKAQLARLIELADRHDFIIVGDECYSEIYLDEQPPGLLEVCAELGRDDFRRCMVFNSLSKRSNLAGLRSGFVAGDAALIGPFAQYRAYHGCAPALAVQGVSEAAWRDEAHVVANRALYQEKIAAVLELLDSVLDMPRPEGGFFLWPQVPIDDAEFVQRLFVEQHVTLLPGSYLARGTEAGNPGRNRVRMALVAPQQECIEAAERIREFVAGL